MLLNLVSAGFGMTILPESVLSLSTSNHLRVYRIKDDPFFVQPRVVWRKNGYLTKASKAFLALFGS